MNCRAAQRLLSAEQDGALAEHERAALQAHVGPCAECGRFRVALGEEQAGLCRAAARVQVPDEERAWQDIRRELRAGRPGGAHAWRGSVRWALPLGAAALLALLALGPQGDDESARRIVARADFVEVPGDTSSMVYVDDQSGWLVVWASAASGADGG